MWCYKVQCGRAKTCYSEVVQCNEAKNNESWCTIARMHSCKVLQCNGVYLQGGIRRGKAQFLVMSKGIFGKILLLCREIL